jgi:hypothetical protein
VGLAPHKRETRLAQGREFRSLYRILGHDRSSIAKFLRVTPRTLFNWETGRAAIPFAAFKLVRLMARSELPSEDWRGWTFNRGTLWSPEGHGYKPSDFGWLSHTIRQARLFPVLYRECNVLQRELAAAMLELVKVRSSGWGHADGRVPVTPPVCLTGEKTEAIGGAL